ncbi:MAG: glycosyltransferase [Desulfobacteraceae bacterium]|nr:MAG: glycosyltransferase [Desulfobacteraceae bacterium]
MIELTLLVPLYNEAHCIEENFSKLEEYLSGQGEEYEILLVNDGSSDSTAEIVDRLAAERPHARALHTSHNRGKGHAVRSGMLNSKGKFIVFTDADLAVPVIFIGSCLSELRRGARVVIGSRHLPESVFKVRQGFMRQFLGEVFRRFTVLALRLRVSDVTCGLKGFEKSAALEIFSRSRIERWGYDAEILFLARRLGHTIKEIPVEWAHRDNSKVRIVTDTLRTIGEIVKIHCLFIAKKYR